MAQDQIYYLRDGNGVELIPIAIPLDEALGIYLIQVFEEKPEAKKNYLRSELIMVRDYILTSSFCDTIHFLEEINLFDSGNDQNRYLSVTEYKATKNLKLKYDGYTDIFISKSVARGMYKIFNMSFLGYSLAALFENEFRFTPETLTQLLHKFKFLLKNSTDD